MYASPPEGDINFTYQIRVNKEKVIGWYLIISGIWGLFVLLRKAFAMEMNTNQMLISILFIALYAGLSYSGFATLRKYNYYLLLILVFMILQMVQFSFDSFSFAFAGGSYIGVEFYKQTNFFFKPLYTYFALSFEPSGHFGFGINFTPFSILFVLRNELQEKLI